MLAWDDVLDAENLPKSVIVMPYRSQKNLGVEAARRGHDVVEASDAFCYLDYVQGLENDPYEYQPFGCCVSWQKISRFDPAADYPPELRGRVLGAQGNLWTELVPDFKGVEWRTWPRMAVMATVLAEGPAVDDWAFGDRMVAVVEKLKSMGVNTAPLNPCFSGKLDLESGVRCVHLRPDFARLRPHEQISTRRNPTLPSGAFVADLDWSQIEVEASDEAGFTNACRQIRRLARPKAGGVMEFPACRLECGDVPFRALPLEEMTVRRAWTNAVTGAALDYLWHEPRHMQLGANYPLYVLKDRTRAADLLNDWRRGFFDAFLVLVPEQEDVEELVDALGRMVRPLDRTRVIREGDCPSRSGCQGNG